MSTKDKKLKHIRLLRHGVVQTGGARFEHFLLKSLAALLQERQLPYKTELYEAARLFRGPANLKLLLWGYKHACADINIVTARLALSSLYRNSRNESKTLIVLHNYDPDDDKRLWLKIYFRLLFDKLKHTSGDKAAIICVSPFFKKQFQAMFPNLPVFLVYNLFDSSFYSTFRTSLKDKRKIFLGQLSSKNDPAIFRLATMLKEQGFKPYFCTLISSQVVNHPDYEVKHVSFTGYLNEMASAVCTVSLPGVNEGWSRLTHESILVGTPVIGYGKGGLGDLLRASDNYIVETVEEAFELIKEDNLQNRAPGSFYRLYDISQANAFINPIVDYMYAD